MVAGVVEIRDLSMGRPASWLSLSDTTTLEFFCEQADVPAEQSAAVPDARVSGADADQGGPRHPGGAAAQGPHRVVCLTRPPGRSGCCR